MDIEKFLKILRDGGKLTLTVHKCADGGVLYEIYKHPDFGQLAIRTVPPGKRVGEHLHHMREWWLSSRERRLFVLSFQIGYAG